MLFFFIFVPVNILFLTFRPRKCGSHMLVASVECQFWCIKWMPRGTIIQCGLYFPHHFYGGQCWGPRQTYFGFSRSESIFFYRDYTKNFSYLQEGRNIYLIILTKHLFVLKSLTGEFVLELTWELVLSLDNFGPALTPKFWTKIKW